MGSPKEIVWQAKSVFQGTPPDYKRGVPTPKTDRHKYETESEHNVFAGTGSWVPRFFAMGRQLFKQAGARRWASRR